MKLNRHNRNEFNSRSKGQSTVEMVLILSLFVTIIYIVSAQFKSNEVFANIISGPWQALSGIIQNGAWKPPDQSMGLHPNNNSRHVSLYGEAP